MFSQQFFACEKEQHPPTDESVSNSSWYKMASKPHENSILGQNGQIRHRHHL